MIVTSTLFVMSAERFVINVFAVLKPLLVLDRVSGARTLSVTEKHDWFFADWKKDNVNFESCQRNEGVR